MKKDPLGSPFSYDLEEIIDDLAADSFIALPHVLSMIEL